MAINQEISDSAENVLCPVCVSESRLRFILSDRKVMRCNSCGLMFAHPMPSQERLSQYYRDLYYPGGEMLRQSGGGVLARIFNEHLRAYCNKLDFAGLDFGSGSGDFVAVARAAGFDFVGLDRYTSETAMVFRSIEEVESYKGKKASFDLITGIEVIEHLTDPKETLQNLWKLLRPGGALFLTTPNFGGLKSKILGRKYEQLLNPTHLLYFNEKSLKLLLRSITGTSPIRLRSPDVYEMPSAFRRFSRNILSYLGLDGSLWIMVIKQS